MHDDDPVREIRRIRAKLMETHGDDLHSLCEFIRSQRDQYSSRLVTPEQMQSIRAEHEERDNHIRSIVESLAG